MRRQTVGKGIKMIEEIKKFSLAKHEGPYENWPSKTDLFFDGKPTGKKIDGYVIEKQFKIDDYYLIITSYDCPFEETNNFILLNNNFSVEHKKWIGRPYNSFCIKDAVPINDYKILILFIGDLKVTLHIKMKSFLSSKPRIKLNWFTT